MDKQLPNSGGAGLIWLKPETYDALVEAARKAVVPDPVQFETVNRAGKTYFRYREPGSAGGPGLGGGGGRFIVSFDAPNQLLRVGEGSVAWSLPEQPDSVTRPYVPKLEGISLSLNPGWAVGGLTPGTEYEVTCIYDSNAGRMELRDPEEELELEEGERARLIATVSFQNAGAGMAIAQFSQRWHDNIEDEGVASISSSFSGSGDDDSDSDGGGGDSGSDDDSDDSSSSSISSSSGCGCPGVTIENAVTMMVGAEASLPPEDWFSTEVGFNNAIDPEDVLIVVETKVEPPEGDCEVYRGRLWLSVEVGLISKKSVFLGQAMGGSFVTEHLLTGTACEVKNITACVSSFGNSPSSGLPALGPCCGEPYDITLPPVIGEGPCPEP